MSRADEFPDEVFLTEEGPDGQTTPVRYQEGDFVFRLSGRDRQRSASYYTPEVLTEFTVRHTLEVYWEDIRAYRPRRFFGSRSANRPSAGGHSSTRRSTSWRPAT